MNKIIRTPGTVIYPLPAIMVSCGATPEEYNIITISWTGTVNSIPPMCSISVRPERYSYEIIKRNMSFVINLTTKQLIEHADFCGVKSGKDINKFKETGLTPVMASKINAPIIKESPVNIECKVNQIISLGSHDMFLAEVVAVQIDENLIDKISNTLNISEVDLITYVAGNYFELGNIIGKTGFSLKKKTL